MPARDLVEGGYAEVDGAGSGDLREFVAYSGEADPQSFCFAGPSLALGFGDPVEQVVADFLEAAALGWVGAQHRAADAPLTELPEGPSEFFPGVNGL